MNSRTAAGGRVRSKVPASRLPCAINGGNQSVSRAELLVNGSDEAFRRLLYGLFALRSHLYSLREGHGAAVGMKGLEFVVLVTIERLARTTPTGIKHIARVLFLNASMTTALVNQLCQKGLVTKKAATSDRRRVVLAVTAEANMLLKRLSVTQCQVNDMAFQPLSGDEFVKLLDMVERLVASSERAVAMQRFLKLPVPSRRRAGLTLG